jgi:hypothetical protein
MYCNIKKNMYCNNEKYVLQHPKNMYCNIDQKKYVLQHRKLCAATLKIMCCNIKNYVLQHKKLCTASSNTATSQNTSVATNQKIPLQHSKIIYCNIQKKPIATREKQKKSTIQPLAHHLELTGGRRE